MLVNNVLYNNKQPQAIHYNGETCASLDQNIHGMKCNNYTRSQHFPTKLHVAMASLSL